MRRSGFFSVAPIFVVVAALVSACGGGGSSTDRREFTLQGQVLALSADRKEANIKHEDIKGFMPAMTMPYKVREAKEFDGIVPGDLINATLVVVPNDAYLTKVTKVGQAPLERAPQEGGVPAGSPGAEILKEGQPVPNASLVDQDGKKRDL